MPPDVAAPLDATAPQAERERALVVRELHDLVSHLVSQIAVHAGALEALSRVRRPDLASAVGPLMRLTRDAMDDLRRIGAALDGGHALPYGPQPGLRALEELVAERAGATLAGLPAEPASLPASTALCLFRVTQQVLAIAPEAAVAVRVRDRRGGVELELALAGPGLRPLLVRGALDGVVERIRLQGGTMQVVTDGEASWLLAVRV